MKIDPQNIGFRVDPNNFSKFRPGQKVSGKVMALFQGKPVIKFGSSPPMVTFSKISLEVGQTVNATVTKKEKNRIFMKIEAAEQKKLAPSSKEITSNLKKLSLENTKENFQIVKQMISRKLTFKDMEVLKSFYQKTGIKLDEKLLDSIISLKKMGLNLSIENLVKTVFNKKTMPSQNFLGQLSLNIENNIVEANDIKKIIKLLEPKTLLSLANNKEISQDTLFHLTSQKMIEHSDSNFFYYDLPFFINSESDNIRLIFKRKKKSDKKNDQINSYMVSLKLKKLGKLVFQVWQKKKRLSISAYTDNRLSHTLIKMFFPKLSERLSEKGYSIVKQQSVFRETIKDPVDKAVNDLMDGHVDFIV